MSPDQQLEHAYANWPDAENEVGVLQAGRKGIV